ncbi:MAG TPA: DUF4240 domain-containing protein [Kofleriaceae bacterium]|nr:DUF4240 domain-containing protein [Kofleriaceae bacterium]
MASSDPADAAFWAMIEAAWRPRGKTANAARAKLAARTPDEDEADTEAIDDSLDDVIDALRTAFAALPQDQLVAMDRVLERKLYEIDRQDLQDVTDGSDDGFLYCRGYIVALGQAFYEAVVADPEIAICDAECEEMCYLPAHVHEERFGALPKHDAGISRETGSNKAGWS